MKLIDLHCHILPGVDDGSKDLQMSLDLAKVAVDQGITIVCLHLIIWMESIPITSKM